MRVEVQDDSGAAQDILEIPAMDVDDFAAQLPEGWGIEILYEEDEIPVQHGPGCTTCDLVDMDAEHGVILMRECLVK